MAVGAGKRRITDEDYDRMLAAFRETPGKCDAVARKCGFSYHTARAAWEKGWSHQRGKSRMIAIKDALYLEMEAARARRAKEAEDAEKAKEEQRAKAREDAIRTITEEAQAVKGGRGLTINVMAAIIPLVKGAADLAKQIEGAIVSETLTTAEKMRHIRSVASLTKQVNEAVRLSLENERLRVGKPTAIMETQHKNAQLTPEEAAEELELLHKSLEERSSELPEEPTTH